MERQSTDPKIIQGKTGEEFLADLERHPENSEAAEAFRVVLAIAKEVERRGGLVLLTGGSVRDELLGLSLKDFDLEAYHLPPEEMKEIAGQHGKIEEDIGKIFPVLKLSFGRSQLDIGFPRREKKTGVGHRGFSAVADPAMTVAEAVRRRDFTINALVKNPLDGEIIDYVGGLNDVAEKRLRAVDLARFVEDPLRVLRGVQFAGRFGLSVDPETKTLLADTAPRLTELARDRLRIEWEKLFNRADQPSTGLELARQIGIFSAYPEIQALRDTPQDPKYHPEGDVWTHTKMVVDRAAGIAQEHRLPPDERLVVTLAAFGHDVGKATKTTVEPDGRIRSNGHEQAGLGPMERWMTAQGFTVKTIAKVLPIIAEHMHPTDLYETDRAVGLGPGPIRRIARRLHPATIKELVLMCQADHFGRSLPTTEFPAGAWLRERAASMHIDEKKPEPVLRGRDLQALGYQAGVLFGKIQKIAEHLAEEKNMTRLEILDHIKNHQTPEAALSELESLG